MFDCVIRGGTVVDGTGSEPRAADVAIQDGRIAEIGDVPASGVPTIDAGGRIVAPGFVDIHTHYDAQAFWDGDLTPSPEHGVTSIVGGNCGFSIAPLSPDAADYLLHMLARVEGIPASSLQEGVPWDWTTTAEYLDRLEGRLAVNAGFLVGHSALRRVVMGERAVGEPATKDDLDGMRRLLSDGLTAGGLGFSSTWATTHNDADGNPVPSRAASIDELVSLASVVREHPGTTLEFLPSIEDFADKHLEAMTGMSLAANRPLNWNVLTVTGWDRDTVETQLAASDWAAERGAVVKALTIPDPLTIRLTFKTGFVFDSFPGWAKPMALPDDEKLAMLSDPEQRKRLDELAKTMEGRLRGLAEWTPLTVSETFSPQTKQFEGKGVWEIAQETGKTPFDALCDIVVADELMTGLSTPPLGEDDDSWRARVDVWRDGRAVVGASDAGAHLDMITTFDYTTRLLYETVQKRGLLPVEEAVQLLTDVPARLYGLKGRGRLAPGWAADIVVFDLDRVKPDPVSTRFDLPSGAGRLYCGAAGIEHVLVNGIEILTDGEYTGARPGTILRSGRDTETVTVPGGN